MANYIGMNYNLDGVAFDCLDGTTIMAFKDDVVQFFTNEVLTSTASRIAMFPEVGTSQINYVYRGGQSSVAGQFYQIWLWNTAGDYWRYEVFTPHQNPTTYTFLQTGSHPWKVNRGPAGSNDDLMFKNDNGVMKVDQLGNTGNFQPYGAGNSLYPTLPNTQIPDACWNNTLDGYVYVSIVDTIYKLDAVNATMVSFKKYNVPPGPVVNIFNGVPRDHTSSIGFDNDPTITYFFRMNPSTNLNQVFIHDETTNTTTISDIGIPTMFPDLPTNIAITHGSENQPANLGDHLIFWVDNTISPPLQYIVATSPTVTVTSGSQNLNNVYHVGASVEQVSTNTQWYAIFGWDFFYAVRGSISHLLATGNYGAAGQPYAGLPYIGGGPQVETEYCSILRVSGQENQVYLFTPTGDAIILDLLAQQISSTVPYGPIAPAPVVPPVALPDIDVLYSAPSQFNLFASDVSLVAENQYGWNFTKTINDANKMELYLYFVQPGNPIFYYNELLELTVNMKNNLALGSGNIFFTVYTVGTAGGWYGTKTNYFGNPALGTVINAELTETVIPISDPRSDQILAISIGSNTASPQVNLDVENVSFNILMPTTNNSQRVRVKLQNNFIVLDNNYWNLDNIATARLNTTIIPAFDIQEFNPNIIAGNFPQNATARESASGCALFVSGTWQLWETTDGTTWTPTPNATITLIPQIATTPLPGPSSNGFAYIGTLGTFDNYGTALPVLKRPVAWEVTSSNQFDFTWTGAAAQSLAPLSNMTTPNNFTGAQMASGFFDTSATAGSISVGVWISTATSPSGNPVASRDIDVVVKSATEISLKRSWELTVTTYILNPNNPKEITGQYTDPAYTTSLAPTSFSMPGNWIELANNDTHFEILFSAGLNNSLPAESQNFRQMTVTPTPTNTEITFTWVANYYTLGNILIGPVAGIQTTGLVSGFTTGGSLKPANAAYILYGCTSSENVDAFTSLVFIEPVAVPPFILTFQSASNQISTDGTYTVSPNPSQVVQYDAVFRDIAGASLGAVPGFVVSGTTSSFTITYATLPATVAWIDYQATDGTTTAQLSITIIPEVSPPEPPTPGTTTVAAFNNSNSFINHINYNILESHKKMNHRNLTELELRLLDENNKVAFSSTPIYYELEIKYNGSIF